MAGSPRSSHLLGMVLALAGVAWVLWQIFGPGSSFDLPASGGTLPAGFGGRRMLLAVALGAILYALLSLLLAAAWWWLTGVYGSRRPLVVTAAVWARTQIAKYLPGNVFHYLGRQALGRRLGLGHQALVASHLLEIASLFAAAALIGAGGAIATRSPASAAVSLPLIAAVAVTGLLAWPFADAALRRLPVTAETMAALPRFSVAAALRLLLPALASHAAFLAGTGLLMLLLLRAAGPTDLGPADVLWVYALAWVAGMLTPGAPGGLGIREAVLTLGLGGVLGSGHAAALALGLRLVTLLGDVLTFGIGMLIPMADHDPHDEASATLVSEEGAGSDG